MKPFRWNPDKNEALQISRGVSFEIIVVAIGAGGLLDILMHPNQAKYPQQRVLVGDPEVRAGHAGTARAPPVATGPPATGRHGRSPSSRGSRYSR